MTRPAALVLALLLSTSCAPQNGAGTAETTDGAGAETGPVLARVGGEPVHQGELDAWLRDDLFREATEGKDEGTLYEFRREGLERMIATQLLEAEAERQGRTIGEIHNELVADVEVTDAEVERFYQENQERLVDASLDEMRPRIRNYLEQQQRTLAWREFVQGLHEDANVELLMTAPRVEVAAVGPMLGPETAPVTIVEFSDFNCPFCQRVTPTLKELRARYPQEVRIVFRHFPLGMHPRARAIAEAAVCADEQGRFWAFHDRVFETAEPMSDEEILTVAGELALDLEAFEACLASERPAQVVERDMAAGKALGVTGTPAFFVNGVRISGAQPLEAFVERVESELAEAGTAGAEAPSS